VLFHHLFQCEFFYQLLQGIFHVVFEMLVLTIDTGYILALCISVLVLVFYVVAAGLISIELKRNAKGMKDVRHQIQRVAATTYTGIAVSIVAIILCAVLMTSVPEVESVMNGLILAIVVSGFFLLWSILSACLLKQFLGPALAVTVAVFVSAIGVYISAMYIGGLETLTLPRGPSVQ